MKLTVSFTVQVKLNKQFNNGPMGLILNSIPHYGFTEFESGMI
jgi:hypothetical protein